MLFNTPAFVAFFLAFYIVFHLLLRKNEHKLWAITVGSAIFYASFDYRFVGILLIIGIADHWIARAIGAADNEATKRRYVVLSVTLKLAMLAFFKFANFFHDNSFALLLPLGLSFYIFQSISYILDVYRGAFRPGKVHEFVASLMFFPRLAAGPIVRASSMMPQFEAIKPPSWEHVLRGFMLIAFGLVKKTIADLIAPVVASTFDGQQHGLLETWSGVLGFTVQIYADVAGYTDMAIGIALLLGFELPLNFRLPYLARSPAEFWNRWHISLSTWLRDYLFTPLVTRYRTHLYMCLIITCFLAGLWHGPDWNYVVCGVYHGALLVTWNWVSRRLPDRVRDLPDNHWSRYLAIIFTFHLVLIGFVIFRAPSWDVCFEVVRGMYWPTVASLTTWSAVTTFALIVFALVFCHLIDYLALCHFDLLKRPAVMWLVCAVAFSFTFVFGGKALSFIYFQF